MPGSGPAPPRASSSGPCHVHLCPWPAGGAAARRVARPAPCLHRNRAPHLRPVRGGSCRAWLPALGCAGLRWAARSVPLRCGQGWAGLGRAGPHPRCSCTCRVFPDGKSVLKQFFKQVGGQADSPAVGVRLEGSVPADLAGTACNCWLAWGGLAPPRCRRRPTAAPPGSPAVQVRLQEACFRDLVVCYRTHVPDKPVGGWVGADALRCAVLCCAGPCVACTAGCMCPRPPPTRPCRPSHIPCPRRPPPAKWRSSRRRNPSCCRWVGAR